ncbi:hypothetical protein K443DRAFT_438359 [Laccaria amethystina LaAM-08-1]|uniref:Uncharacterized protein n=1 Tax=Laccaria amethystina LaAM-08-1 TaxID=1095629 RepID=A0A0C9X7J5_9AGAR|nr:hypothetical protein K443DRAFT_438359 [Laccaria amethystina LaAM-08-1]
MRSVYPTIPHKLLVLIGLVVCCLSGAMTPIFSFFLSRLLFEVAIGARDYPPLTIRWNSPQPSMASFSAQSTSSWSLAAWRG